jgi:hypothetical protein
MSIADKHGVFRPRSIREHIKVYLIGSLRNEEIPAMAYSLRGYGFDVFDDWHGAGPTADDEWHRYEQQRKRTMEEALAGYAAQQIFNFDRKHIEESDAVILALPAGRSGHLEFGYARGLGKFGVIQYDKEPDRWDVMYNFANAVTTNLEATVQKLKDHFQ